MSEVKFFEIIRTHNLKEGRMEYQIYDGLPSLADNRSIPRFGVDRADYLSLLEKNAEFERALKAQGQLVQNLNMAIDVLLVKNGKLEIAKDYASRINDLDRDPTNHHEDASKCALCLGRELFKLLTHQPGDE